MPIIEGETKMRQKLAKSFSLIVLALILIIICPAGNLSAASPPTYHGKALNHTMSFGLSMYHFDYKEDVSPPLKSEVSGDLPGAYMEYTYDRLNSIYYNLLAEYARYDLTYDGTTQGGTPVSFDDPQEYRRFEGNIGYTLDTGRRSSLVLYWGLGYRQWNRSEAKDHGVATSYKEEYEWLYMPVGAKIIFELGDDWRVEPNFAFRVMLDGKMKAKMGKIGGQDLEFELGNETGWYASVAVKYYLSRHWGVELTPWMEKSKIGKSNMVGGYYEPASDTTMYGINMGIVFSF